MCILRAVSVVAFHHYNLALPASRIVLHDSRLNHPCLGLLASFHFTGIFIFTYSLPIHRYYS